MEKDELQKLIDENLSTRKIAAKIGKSQGSIKHWLKKFNLKTNITYVKNDSYICTKCFKQCEISDFYQKSKRKGRHTYCKKCFNTTIIERQKRNKELAVLYKGGCCSKCGYSKYIGALQFHHLDPNIKDPNWKAFKNRKFDKKYKFELDKCELLCANCHAEVHNIE